MTIDQLKHLILIHHLGSINKASEQAHMSQQNMSTSMKNLENEIGRELLIRSPQGIRLSENGVLLVEAAEAMVAVLNGALQKMADGEDKNCQAAAEHLTFFFPPVLSTTLLPTLVKGFSAEYPAVKLTAIEKEAQETLRILPEAEALGVIDAFEEDWQPPSGLICQLISQDKLCVAVSLDHPLAKQHKVSAKALLKYPLALYQSSHDTPSPIGTLLEQYDKPEYHIITNNYALYQNAIAAQGAAGFLPRSSLRNNTGLPDIRDKVAVIPVTNVPSLCLYLCAQESYYQAHLPSIQALLRIYKTLL